MPARHHVTEASTNQIAHSIQMPVSSMKKLKNGKEEYELLEESFIIPMSSTAAAASADEEC